MKKRSILSLLYYEFLPVLLLLLTTVCNAQSLTIPKGFTLQKSIKGSDNLIQKDFDGDGHPDYFGVIERGETEVKLISQLSTLKNKILLSESIELYRCCASMVLKKDVIQITTDFTPTFAHYKFRYDGRSSNFQLIGYDAIEGGTTEGGSSSFNLLTNTYENNFSYYDHKKQQVVSCPAVKAKLTIQKILLTDFGQKAERMLKGINEKYIPRKADKSSI
ncbi:hypothetical protein [Spirosoma fluviale]|uniref:Uncharacterized protein n=1 Tax=Spirosoma fluviale TaxID=1597977 RepID=A0A286G3B8_9BACT|nr:hypothetical protein [Spirosoma fluviale]SOD90021.1 hypothetical protein SAMN06269250_3270 [Spirosoma fluviale]